MDDRGDHTAKCVVNALLVVLLFCGTGCQTPLMRSVPETTLQQRGDFDLVTGVNLPEVRGVEGCGAQALAAVLAFDDPGLDATALGEELPWHDEGATPVDLLLVARDRGCTARVARGTWEALVTEVQRDRPVLVMLDSALAVPTLFGPIPTPRVMHWAVVSGVARDDSQMLLAAPRERHFVVHREDFMRRWSTSAYCMIVVEKERVGAE